MVLAMAAGKEQEENDRPKMVGCRVPAEISRELDQIVAEINHRDSLANTNVSKILRVALDEWLERYRKARPKAKGRG